MSKSAGFGDKGISTGIPPDLKAVLGLITLGARTGNQVKYDDFGLSEGEWLAAATLIPLTWQTPLSPYEIDVEDGNKIQKVFDLPIQSMGNRTCNEVAQLAGMQLVDGEKAY